MKIYVGYGPEHGVHVYEDSALPYVMTQLSVLRGVDRLQLETMVQSGITADELVEWYFSGCFAVYDEAEWKRMKKER